MFSKLLMHLDFAKLEARNMIISVLGAAPATPLQGQIYYDSTLLGIRLYDGTATWTNKATDSLLLNGSNSAFYLARANHTGTQLAATIFDLATTVQAYRLDQFTAPITSLSVGSQRIINQADPINPQDSSTKNYVDTQVQLSAAGIASKPAVRAIATANVATLSGPQTIDGVALVANDRVLLTAQTTATQNGPYIVLAGAWTRPTDDGATGELTTGATWYVSEGTTFAASTFRLSNTGVITPGTTSPVINQFTGGISYTAGSGLQLVGSTFSAKVVAAGGVLSSAGGLSIDRTVAPFKAAGLIGNGTLTSMPFVHNLNTVDVVVAVKDAVTLELVGARVVITDVNTVTITTAVAPAVNALRVTVIG